MKMKNFSSSCSPTRALPKITLSPELINFLQEAIRMMNEVSIICTHLEAGLSRRQFFIFFVLAKERIHGVANAIRRL
jgi:hypothetical protein